MRKKRKKIERLTRLDGNEIVWFGTCYIPWDLKVLKRDRTYFVCRVEGDVLLVKESLKSKNRFFHVSDGHAVIRLSNGFIYLAKLEANETCFSLRVYPHCWMVLLPLRYGQGRSGS